MGYSVSTLLSQHNCTVRESREQDHSTPLHAGKAETIVITAIKQNVLGVKCTMKRNIGYSLSRTVNKQALS